MSDNTVCFANLSEFACPLYIFLAYYCVKIGSPEIKMKKSFNLDNKSKTLILAIIRILMKRSTYINRDYNEGPIS